MSISTYVYSIYFPYCIEKQNDGIWVLLNREYKPVGFNTNESFSYSDFPVSAKLSGIGPGIADKLSYSGKAEGDRIYLYNDGCNPINSKDNMDAYMEKLVILGKLKISR